MKKLLIALLSMGFALSTHSVFAHTPHAVSVAQKNKAIVLTFYQKLFGDKDISAIDQYIVKDYIQHNPAVADGRDALKQAVSTWFAGVPKEKLDFRNVAAEGDLVFVHLRSVRPDGTPHATIDIFRLDKGKIVEHWDVSQEVPEKAANPHPMF